MNTPAAKVEEICRCAIVQRHQHEKSMFMSKCECLKANGKIDTHAYPDFPEEWVGKSPALLKAFVNDSEAHKADLLNELHSIRSTYTLAIDHQQGVVSNVKQDPKKTKSQRSPSPHAAISV